MVEKPRHHWLRDNFCADTLVSEDFQQNGMGRAAIDDVRLPHPPGQCIQAGVNFG
jgi:predicted acetyltransferase